eukprot:jgi/Tetstr1/435453/TSEL_024359.t1
MRQFRKENMSNLQNIGYHTNKAPRVAFWQLLQIPASDPTALEKPAQRIVFLWAAYRNGKSAVQWRWASFYAVTIQFNSDEARRRYRDALDVFEPEILEGSLAERLLADRPFVYVGTTVDPVARDAQRLRSAGDTSVVGDLSFVNAMLGMADVERGPQGWSWRYLQYFVVPIPMMEGDDDRVSRAWETLLLLEWADKHLREEGPPLVDQRIPVSAYYSHGSLKHLLEHDTRSAGIGFAMTKMQGRLDSSFRDHPARALLFKDRPYIGLGQHMAQYYRRESVLASPPPDHYGRVRRDENLLEMFPFVAVEADKIRYCGQYGDPVFVYAFDMKLPPVSHLRCWSEGVLYSQACLSICGEEFLLRQLTDQELMHSRMGCIAAEFTKNVQDVVMLPPLFECLHHMPEMTRLVVESYLSAGWLICAVNVGCVEPDTCATVRRNGLVMPFAFMPLNFSNRASLRALNLDFMANRGMDRLCLARFNPDFLVDIIAHRVVEPPQALAMTSPVWGVASDLSCFQCAEDTPSPGQWIQPDSQPLLYGLDVSSSPSTLFTPSLPDSPSDNWCTPFRFEIDDMIDTPPASPSN